jgi:hypothetical protein
MATYYDRVRWGQASAREVWRTTLRLYRHYRRVWALSSGEDSQAALMMAGHMARKLDWLREARRDKAAWRVASRYGI